MMRLHGRKFPKNPESHQPGQPLHHFPITQELPRAPGRHVHAASLASSFDFNAREVTFQTTTSNPDGLEKVARPAEWTSRILDTVTIEQQQTDDGGYTGLHSGEQALMKTALLMRLNVEMGTLSAGDSKQRNAAITDTKTLPLS